MSQTYVVYDVHSSVVTYPFTDSWGVVHYESEQPQKVAKATRKASKRVTKKASKRGSK